MRAIQFDGEIETEEQRQELVAFLMYAPLQDQRDRSLYVRFARQGDYKNASERRRLYAICGDLEKQVVLSCDPAVGFQHVRDASDPPGWYFFTKRQFAAMFVAVATGEKAVPHPDPDSRAQILLGGSINDCDVEQSRFAIESALELGNRLHVEWTQPKNPHEGAYDAPP